MFIPEVMNFCDGMDSLHGWMDGWMDCAGAVKIHHLSLLSRVTLDDLLSPMMSPTSVHSA